MSWRYGRSTADHPLPIGVVEHAATATRVNAGDVIASGVALGTAVRVSGARRLGLAPSDMERELRVRVGGEVAAGTLLARTGRRFPRTLTSPMDGRVLAVTADGDLYIAPIVDRWVVRSTLDGVVTRSDDGVVRIEGAAWCIEGVAAYGPDAIGELTLGVADPMDDLQASRLDVRLGGRIIVGGARVSAEVMTRAHACGVVGLVAGAAPAAGLRVVYGDTVTASGGPGREDRPTVLCLIGFGGSALPRQIFLPLLNFAGSRAAIHTQSARLFVFAPAEAGEVAARAPDLAITADYGGVRTVGECEFAGEVVLPSEVRTEAVRCGSELIPSANIRSFQAGR